MSNNTLLKLALGVGSVIFAGLVAKKVIDHKIEKKAEKKDKKQKEKSCIHPRVRGQIMMAKASAKIAQFVIKNQDQIVAATKVVSLGAAVLSLVRVIKGFKSDKQVTQDLVVIKDDLGYLRSKDYTSGKYHEIWLKGWQDSSTDVLKNMRKASELKKPFWMTDNPDGDFAFNVEEITA